MEEIRTPYLITAYNNGIKSLLRYITKFVDIILMDIFMYKVICVCAIGIFSFLFLDIATIPPPAFFLSAS